MVSGCPQPMAMAALEGDSVRGLEPAPDRRPRTMPHEACMRLP